MFLKKQGLSELYSVNLWHVLYLSFFIGAERNNELKWYKSTKGSCMIIVNKEKG